MAGEIFGCRFWSVVVPCFLCLPVCLHLCFCLQEEIMQFWKPVFPLMNQQFSSSFDVSFIIQALSCLKASFLFSCTVSQTVFSLLLSNQMDHLILLSSVDAPHSLVITEIARMAWGLVTPLTRDSLHRTVAWIASLQLRTLSLPPTYTLAHVWRRYPSYRKECQLHSVTHIIS